MSDKTIGIIGQKYEDRKTGKSGCLESRDLKYRTLIFRADDSSTFSISFASFRSNWRKVKDNGSITNTDEQDQVEQPTDENLEKLQADDEVADVENNEETKVEPINDDVGYIRDFDERVSDKRKVEITHTTDALTICVDNVSVVRIIDNLDGTFNVAMLPDIFTDSDWMDLIDVASIDYKIGLGEHLNVILDTSVTSLKYILNAIEEAVININLYGYIEEEDCANEIN